MKWSEYRLLIAFEMRAMSPSGRVPVSAVPRRIEPVRGLLIEFMQ